MPDIVCPHAPPTPWAQRAVGVPHERPWFCVPAGACQCAGGGAAGLICTGVCWAASYKRTDVPGDCRQTRHRGDTALGPLLSPRFDLQRRQTASRLGGVWGAESTPSLGRRRSAGCAGIQVIRSFVRIWCPRQDSNLRSRLRSPFPGMALTCRNVLAEVLPGRVSGAARLPGRLGPVVRVRGARRPALRRRSLRAVSRRGCGMRTTGVGTGREPCAGVVGSPRSAAICVV
jgi:hypothetical protein